MEAFRSGKTRGRTRLRALLLLLILPVMAGVAQGADTAQGLLSLLPPESRLSGWILDGAPQTAAGQELYLLINGGAEIYMQEGFQRAVLASYGNADGKVINVEIYEMAAAENARHIQQLKIGARGKATPVGEEAVLEDYFLNMRQGRFQATFSGYDAEKDTVAALLEMARMVVENIKSQP